MRVVIIGASLAGLRAAQALRQRGFSGTILLVGEEGEAPYDRPPLSKDLLLGTKQVGDLGLTDDAAMAELGLELRVGTTASNLQSDRGTVDLDGERVDFDHLIIATGSSPRRLSTQPATRGVVTLRNLADGVFLRSQLEAGAAVVVIGAGFIGCEVASAGVARGCPVTVLEMLPSPLYRSLGPMVGAMVAGLIEESGARARWGTAADRFELDESGHLSAVVTDAGERLDAQVAVVGIGVVPNTDWLAGSGLELADGVVADERLRASGHPRIHAVGDVVRWHHRRLGRQVRVEHWTHATESAAFVAADITGAAATPYEPVPYVWSDQWNRRIQILGLPEPDDHFEVVHGELPGRMVGLYRRDGALSGAVAFDYPGRLMRYRALLERGAPWGEATDLAAELEGQAARS